MSSNSSVGNVNKKIKSEDLAKVRVIQKNLVYCIGLAPSIANEETL